MLKDKIKEYLRWLMTGKNLCTPMDKVAQDIADICEKEQFNWNDKQVKILMLLQENIELKQKIANQRYLQRDEVEDIFGGLFLALQIYDKKDCGIPLSTTKEQILNLAISKDRIIEVLKSHFVTDNLQGYCNLKSFEQIADEIIGGE